MSILKPLFIFFPPPLLPNTDDQSTIKVNKYENTLGESIICLFSHHSVENADYPLGIWLPFIITEYEHGRFWSWKVASIRATGHRIQTTESGGCYLWFDMPMITMPYLLICRTAPNRIEDMLPKE